MQDEKIGSRNRQVIDSFIKIPWKFFLKSGERMNEGKPDSGIVLFQV